MSVDRRHNRIDGQHLEFSVEPNEEKMTDLMDMYIYTDEHNPILGTNHQPIFCFFEVPIRTSVGDR